MRSMLAVMHRTMAWTRSKQDYEDIKWELSQEKIPKYSSFWMLFLFSRHRIVFNYMHGDPKDIPSRFNKFDPKRAWTVLHLGAKIIFIFRDKHDKMRFRLQCEV